MPPPELPPLPPPLPGRRKRSALPAIFAVCGIIIILFSAWTGWAIYSGTRTAIKTGQQSAQRQTLQTDVIYELTWQREPGTKMKPEEVYQAALATVAADHNMTPAKVEAELIVAWQATRQQNLMVSGRVMAAFAAGKFTECVEEADKLIHAKPGWFDRMNDAHGIGPEFKSRALYILDRSPEAVEPARAALVIAKDSGEESHITAQSWLARVLCDCERFEESLALYREAFAAAKKFEVPPDGWTLSTCNSLRWILDEKMDRPGDAEPFARQFVELQRAIEGDPSEEFAKARYTLGELLFRLDRSEDAAIELTAALEQQRTLLEPDDGDLGDTLLQLAELRNHQQRYDEARKLCLEGIKVYTAAHGPENELVKEWQEWLAQLPAAPAPQP